MYGFVTVNDSPVSLAKSKNETGVLFCQLRYTNTLHP